MERRMSEKAVRRKSGGASPGRWEWAKDGDRGARVKCGRVRADRKGARRSERRPFTSPRLLRSFSYHPPSHGPISSNIEGGGGPRKLGMGGRGPVTHKRVPDREEQGKPSNDARRGRCHPLEAGFWPLWMTPLPRSHITEY